MRDFFTWRFVAALAVGTVLAIGAAAWVNSRPEPVPPCPVEYHLIRFPTTPETTARQAVEGLAWLSMGDHDATIRALASDRAYAIDSRGRWGFADWRYAPGDHTILAMVTDCPGERGRETAMREALGWLRP